MLFARESFYTSAQGAAEVALSNVNLLLQDAAGEDRRLAVRDGVDRWRREPLRALVVEAGGRVCGLPLSDVVEAMRPLPLAALADMPPFVLGMAVIRGAPTPVADLAALIGAAPSSRRRWLTVRAGERRVALALDQVIGIHPLDTGRRDVPPLLAETNPLIESLATLDRELLLVLRAGRLLPPALVASLDAASDFARRTEPRTA